MKQSPTIPPVEQFHKLIWQMANYCWQRLPKGRMIGMDQDDLYAEGCLVYSRFLNKFDPSRGYKFITGFQLSLRNHYADIVRNAWRKLPVYHWEDNEDGIMLEDLITDHRAGPLKTDLLGDLSDIANRRLSREAWMVVRCVLDPPKDFLRFIRNNPRRHFHTLIWDFLGYSRFTRKWVEQEIRGAFSA